jgi:hypothetical protein
LWADSPFESLHQFLQTEAVLDWLGVQHFPAESDRILLFLKPLLGEYISDDQAMIQAFDRHEYLISLIHADYRITYEKSTGQQVLFWLPPGSFAYRDKLRLSLGVYVPALRTQRSVNVISLVNQEITEQAHQWPPLAAGLFGASLERLQAAVEFAEKFYADKKHPGGG